MSSTPSAFGFPRGPERLPWEDLEVRLEELDPRAVAIYRRDRQVVELAEPMPVRLIQPAARGEGESSTRTGDVTWGIRAVGADTTPYSGRGVKIAVLDTGIDPEHAAFDGVTMVLENFTSDTSAHDEHGHGTHCAGTIFGRDVDGERIGVARGVETAIIGKVLDGRGRGTTAGVLKGIQWAEDQGANILSLSLAFDFVSLVEALVTDSGMPRPAAISQGLETYRANVRLFDALAQFLEARSLVGRGALICAAAGNESARGGDPPYVVHAGPPAVAPGVVAVGAIGVSRARASGFEVAHFSNRGAIVAAPGVDVRSARVGGGVVAQSGTSMATPHVAGVAALWAEMLFSKAGRPAPNGLFARVVGLARPLADHDPSDVGTGLVMSPQEH